MEELRLLFFISWLIINQHATINAPPKKPTAGIIIRLVLFKSTNIDWSDISETTHRQQWGRSVKSDNGGDAPLGYSPVVCVKYIGGVKYVNSLICTWNGENRCYSSVDIAFFLSGSLLERRVLQLCNAFRKFVGASGSTKSLFTDAYVQVIPHPFNDSSTHLWWFV